MSKGCTARANEEMSSVTSILPWSRHQLYSLRLYLKLTRKATLVEEVKSTHLTAIFCKTIICEKKAIVQLYPRSRQKNEARRS